MCVSVVSSWAQTANFDNEVIDIEAWLDSLVGTPQTTAKSDTVVVVQTQKDTVKIVSPAKDSVVVTPQKSEHHHAKHKKHAPKPSFAVKPIVISREDSLRFAREALDECLQNPILMDWVFGTDAPDTFPENDAESIIAALRTEAKAHVAATEPELFSMHCDDLPDVSELKLRTRQSFGLLEDFLLKQELKRLPETGIKIVRAEKKWTIGGKCSAQLSQSYISPNWYTGGYSNLAILGYVSVKANYDNKKNLRFENSLEWKAGFNSTTSDTLRFLNTNEDIFRITSNLGLRAVKNWYYTLSAEFNTQLFNTFVENSNELSTASFSPIRLYLSLGMEYKFKDIVKVNLSPFSYKLTYVMNESVAEKFNIPAEKNLLNTFGSRVQVDVAYAFSKELKLESKMYVYTDYKNVEFDWEITGNFIANRFLTVQLSLHPRYDSGLVLAEGQTSRFQFREFVSLGFLYAF